MKRNSAILFAAIVLTCTSLAAAAADEKPVIPDDRFVYCTVCHGVQVGGNANLGAPRISGLSAWYVEQQLTAFSRGWRGTHEDDRGGQEMRPMAAVLTPAEIERAARYVDAVESPPAEVTLDGDARHGEILYGSCAACHGVRAEGNAALGSPPLAGLNDWYLLTQLEHFKSGIRGTSPDDTFGQQMQAAVTVLNDEQAMQDVVRYITTLGNDER